MRANLIVTPKHFVAIAASNQTAALGKVSNEMAWKDERRCFVLVAHNERRYSPKAATLPEKMQEIIPGIIPLDAIACLTLISPNLSTQSRTDKREGKHSFEKYDVRCHSKQKVTYRCQ